MGRRASITLEIFALLDNAPNASTAELCHVTGAHAGTVSRARKAWVVVRDKQRTESIRSVRNKILEGGREMGMLREVEPKTITPSKEEVNR